MENMGSGDDLFDRKVTRAFQERPGPMPELPEGREASDNVVELDPESLDLIQAAGDILPFHLRRFIRAGRSSLETDS